MPLLPMGPPPSGAASLPPPPMGMGAPGPLMPPPGIPGAPPAALGALALDQLVPQQAQVLAALKAQAMAAAMQAMGSLPSPLAAAAQTEPSPLAASAPSDNDGDEGTAGY